MNKEEKGLKEITNVIIKNKIEDRTKDNRILKKVTFKKPTIKECNKSDSELNKILDSIPEEERALFDKELELEYAKSSYQGYMEYVYGKQYINTKLSRFLCSCIDNAIERANKGQDVRLCVSMPPRHGKSMHFTETLPSYYIGKYPKRKVIIASYNSDLAEKFGDANRQKVMKFGKDIFQTELSQSQNNKTFWETKEGGGCLSAGLNGTITGFGANLFLVDDPYKNMVDFESFKDRVWSNYQSAVNTRMESVNGLGNIIIVIHTRWNQDDLIGRLSLLPNFEVINLPIICEYEKNDPLGRKRGEVLCKELKDINGVNELKMSCGDDVFNALYMGNPRVDGGNEFKKSTFRYYSLADLPPVFDRQVISVDATFDTGQTNDYVAIQVWGKKGANHYLLKRFKRKLTFNETLERIKYFRSSYSEARTILIEKKANGSAIINTLNDVIGGIKPVTPTESKVARARAVQPYFDSGNVYFPNEQIDPTIKDYEKELLDFPKGAHDDEVDATTQYLNEYKFEWIGVKKDYNYFKQLKQTLTEVFGKGD
jgi:phage uncharacterized protein (putative large terminase), C-terminal domain